MDTKRLAIAVVVLVAVVLTVWFVVRAQKQQRYAEQQAATRPAAKDPDKAEADSPSPSIGSPDAAEPSDAVKPSVAAQPKPRPTRDAAPALARGEQKVRWFGTKADRATTHIGFLRHPYMFRVDFTTVGAAVSAVRLTDHFVTVADKQLYKKDPAGYEAARLKDPDKYKGHYRMLEHVTAEGQEVAAFATRELRVELLDGHKTSLRLSSLAVKSWTIDRRTDHSVTFAYALYRGQSDADKQPALKVLKTYTVAEKDYTIEVTVELKNFTSHRMKVSFEQAGPTGLPLADVRGDNRHAAYGRLMDADRQVQVKMDNRQVLFKEMAIGDVNHLGISDGDDPIVWTGTTNKYFASMLYLRPAEGDLLEAPRWHADFYVEAAGRGQSDRAYLTGVTIGRQRQKASSDTGSDWGILVSPEASRTVTFVLFAGPKGRGIFKDDDNPVHRPLYKRLNYLATINLGGCSFCTLPWLAFGVIWLLNVLSTVTFGNYGLAIILLVTMVRLLLHPLARKSQVSMLKMQKLGPQMQKLKEKYADDKDTLNREMMKLYRQQGASPFLGCLPMLLQMPIWVALFTGINASVQLRHAAFLPVWITDLAAPDALVSWSTPIWLIGNSFNLLPILLTVAMFFQTKLTPQMTQPTGASDQARQQQKMMRYMMPAMMLMFFYKAPSGLTLYIMASTAAGVLDQVMIRRHIRAKEAAEAAVETTVALPGKAARSSRPKKPKGPFWFKEH